MKKIKQNRISISHNALMKELNYLISHANAAKSLMISDSQYKKAWKRLEKLDKHMSRITEIYSKSGMLGFIKSKGE